MATRKSNDGLKKRCGCARKRWTECEHGWHFSFSRGTTVDSEGKVKKKEFRYSLDVEAAKRKLPRPIEKQDALTWRERLRAEIREGKHDAAVPTVDAAAPLTLGDVCDKYERDHISVPTRRPQGQKLMLDHIRVARATEIPGPHATTVRLEDKPITAVTTADLRALRAARVAASQARCAATKRRDAKGGEAGANRLMQRVRHLFTWAIEHDYVTESPFRRGHATIVKANRDAETPRDRRLTGDEEARLLAAASPSLYALIVAALTTGCRKGELLSMRWSQIRETPKPEIRLSASNTKTDKPRTVPLTAKLRVVLSMRKTGPDGQDHGPDAFVFGNEVGEEVKNIKTAWEATCRRAGITGLHFHDLRREAGSHWHEAGVPLVQIQAWLGHSNIVQTSTYLAVSLAGTDEALRLVEAFEATGFAHHSHKPTEQPPSDGANAQASEPAQHVVM